MPIIPPMSRNLSHSSFLLTHHHEPDYSRNSTLYFRYSFFLIPFNIKLDLASTFYFYYYTDCFLYRCFDIFTVIPCDNSIHTSIKFQSLIARDIGSVVIKYVLSFPLNSMHFYYRIFSPFTFYYYHYSLL